MCTGTAYILKKSGLQQARMNLHNLQNWLLALCDERGRKGREEKPTPIPFLPLHHQHLLRYLPMLLAV